MKTYLKYLFITILPFGYIGRSLKLNGSNNKKALLISFISFIIFICFWGNVFSNKDLETQLYQSNDQVFELSRTLEQLTSEYDKQKEELKKTKEYSKLTDKQKAELKKKEKQKLEEQNKIETLVKKLKSDNMIDEPYSIVLDLINKTNLEFEILKTVKHDNLKKEWVTWEQTFKFKTGDIIKTRYKRIQGESIFLPYFTEHVK